jgi:hypothetical protein
LKRLIAVFLFVAILALIIPSAAASCVTIRVVTDTGLKAPGSEVYIASVYVGKTNSNGFLYLNRDQMPCSLALPTPIKAQHKCSGGRYMSGAIYFPGGCAGGCCKKAITVTISGQCGEHIGPPA